MNKIVLFIVLYKIMVPKMLFFAACKFMFYSRVTLTLNIFYN